MSTTRTALARASIVAFAAAVVLSGCGGQDPALDGVTGLETVEEFAEQHFVVLPGTVPERLVGLDALMASGVSYYEFSRDDDVVVAVCVGTEMQCAPAVEGTVLREGVADGLPFTVWAIAPADGEVPADARDFWTEVVMSTAPGWLD
ncbi:hypothetical protein CLV28_2290 [Sediminihabitans luteus]|uniref:Lipoprotein n=1 Tax=Sediminihabitans luteus TaxID=1138585 RepID=A0A2M9CEV3_9CELL|nr:hypothetical protein [Sediminihabitans luteus]PJJ70454.1 hypothetical protein CLV28_2290 [Sediminihabitans luteus]GII97927.1 hypothetical protein Slu03_03050 [Sediminihabitans luteus]